MKIFKITPTDQGYPEVLKTISSSPKQLFYSGELPSEMLKNPVVAIVGSRKVTSYGKRVTEELAAELARRGVVIVSGLALGVDAIAHQAAIDTGGKSIAVLPSGLDEVYPSSNRLLAQKIIETGGSILTEYPEQTAPLQQNFVARNRIVSGLSKALVITEAAEKSGSLHTAKFALDQGREVGAVPGSIYSPTSIGTNNLIKSGAAAISSTEDVLCLIGLTEVPKSKKEIVAANEAEHILMTLMNDGVADSEELLKISGLELSTFNQTLTMLEITGKAKVNAGQWYLT